jgi:transposase
MRCYRLPDGAIMGAAYSVDLRRKVVEACEPSTASQADVAQFFRVSVSFVEKLLRLHRRTGALEPDRRRAGRPAQVDAATCAKVQRWLEEQNDLTLCPPGRFTIFSTHAMNRAPPYPFQLTYDAVVTAGQT